MAKIKTIEELRIYALETLERLRDGEIDTAHAGVVGKVCESAISTVKAQLEYARMIGEDPNIPFMNTHGKLLNAPSSHKELTHKK
jgi:hypothetical protein